MHQITPFLKPLVHKLSGIKCSGSCVISREREQEAVRLHYRFGLCPKYKITRNGASFSTMETNGVRNVPPSRPFGGLTPSEAGKRSAEQRRGEPLVIEDLKKLGPDLLKELVQAAYGRGKWKDLPMEKRLQALFKANEYINGRPIPMKEIEDEVAHAGFRVTKAENSA